MSNHCPLCTEKFDQTDLNFKPCKCGYQMCCWCYKRIIETNAKCPACRADYTAEKIEFKEVKNMKREGRVKKRKKKPNMKKLSEVRVIQRNLVYLVGLTGNVAKEEYLHDNFSQYGRVAKVVVNRSNLHNPSKALANIKEPTVSAYITFAKGVDAKKCINAIDGTWVDGKMLRCSYGTTKYCSYFLRGIKCTNPDCMYLHEMGYENDTFKREEIVLKHGLPLPYTKADTYEVDMTIEKHSWSGDSKITVRDVWSTGSSAKEYQESFAYSGKNYFEPYDVYYSDTDDDMDSSRFANWGSESNSSESSSSISDTKEIPKPIIGDVSQSVDKLEKAKIALKSVLPKTARWGKEPEKEGEEVLNVLMLKPEKVIPDVKVLIPELEDDSDMPQLEDPVEEIPKQKIQYLEREETPQVLKRDVFEPIHETKEPHVGEDDSDDDPPTPLTFEENIEESQPIIQLKMENDIDRPPPLVGEEKLIQPPKRKSPAFFLVEEKLPRKNEYSVPEREKYVRTPPTNYDGNVPRGVFLNEPSPPKVERVRNVKKIPISKNNFGDDSIHPEKDPVHNPFKRPLKTFKLDVSEKSIQGEKDIEKPFNDGRFSPFSNGWGSTGPFVSTSPTIPNGNVFNNQNTPFSNSPGGSFGNPIGRFYDRNFYGQFGNPGMQFGNAGINNQWSQFSGWNNGQAAQSRFSGFFNNKDGDEKKRDGKK